MSKWQKVMLLSLFFIAILLVGCSKDSGQSGDKEKVVETEKQDTEKEEEEEVEEVEEDDGYGGQLKIAINAQPPTLDPHMSTAGATGDISKMMFESLLTIDSKYNPVEMLAEKYEVSEDSKTFTFYLRKGVKFHNGDEMTADDVVASMNRWITQSGVAAGAFGDAKFEKVDDYTVKLELEESSSIAIGVIASNEQFAGIMPEGIIESAAVEGVDELIGTGPYKFVEWKQDQYIHVTRNDDYAPIDTEPDGLSGHKAAYLDDVYYYVVTDASTRLAGIQSKEYDVAYSLPSDNYDQLMDADGIEILSQYTATMDLLYNKRGGSMEDPKMRQALNTLLDVDTILKASLVNDALYTAEASYMNSDIEQWATNAGEDNFNINDPEKAKELFEEAGYDGEPIIIMTTRDYEHYYNASVVIQEQLEQIGIKTDLQVYDWPTITDRREKSDTWDLFVNAFPFKSDPTQLLQLNPGFAGGINDSKADELLHDIRTATSDEEARAKWEELQTYAWEEYLPMSRLASFGSISAVLDDVEGFEVGPGGTVVWNAKLNR